jgi:hypothetical protein
VKATVLKSLTEDGRPVVRVARVCALVARARPEVGCVRLGNFVESVSLQTLLIKI